MLTASNNMTESQKKIIAAHAKLVEAEKLVGAWTWLSDLENCPDIPAPDGWWVEWGLLKYRDPATGEPRLLEECPHEQVEKAKELVEETRGQLAEAIELYHELVAQGRDAESVWNGKVRKHRL